MAEILAEKREKGLPLRKASAIVGRVTRSVGPGSGPLPSGISQKPGLPTAPPCFAVTAPLSPDRENALAALDRNRTLLAQAQGFAYKSVGDEDLAAYVFAADPAGDELGDRPAILFFHSSAWDAGLVSQFAPHCLHFAQRGMVAIAVDYRVESRHGTGPLEAMADARSAIRWVRRHSSELGVLPDRIVASGASGGAYLALMAAMGSEEFDDPSDNPAISAVPDALVLFDPVVDTHTKTGFGVDRFPNAATARKASPITLIRKGLPPMMMLAGTNDRVLPFATTRKFAASSRRWPKRNVCELVPFDGCGHSFFNFNVDPRLFESSLAQADRFLVSLGYLAAADHADSWHRLHE